MKFHRGRTHSGFERQDGEAQTRSQLLMVLGNDLTFMFPVCPVGEIGIPTQIALLEGVIDKLETYHHKLVMNPATLSAKCTKLLFLLLFVSLQCAHRPVPLLSGLPCVSLYGCRVELWLNREDTQISDSTQ